MAIIIRTFSTLALIFTLSFFCTDAYASGPMNRNFGLGVSLGNPTSLTGKYYMGSGNNAIDFHIGTFRSYNSRRYGGTIFLAGDYLFDVWTFVENSTLKMPFYVGPGAALLIGQGRDGYYFDRGYYSGYRSYGLGVGARLVVGTALQFQTAPFEIFLDLSPTLMFLFHDQGGVGNYFAIDNLALGARFFF
ncbi:MAG: DUF3996 domain-containing protein [Bradymonadaceae bacterium]|nr:DUF3996 domain-containing protein [Lujinxingiaceae bacterium]